ncbi:hypothetical protein [Nocardia wallacei]|uniref:hypothetical protein n=1 Tax=Nocardia wallacei TaxID=480035 RepID=UPI001656E212|nr:hypothetical protein [Nocardia wallacei]
MTGPPAVTRTDPNIRVPAGTIVPARYREWARRATGEPTPAVRESARTSRKELVMNTIPAGAEADRAEQATVAHDSLHGLDTTRVHPLAERMRAAFDAADIADRVDQAWITPLDEDAYDRG